MFSSLSHKLFLYEIDFNELKENYDRYIKVNNQILQIFELEINTYNYCIENKFIFQVIFGIYGIFILLILRKLISMKLIIKVLSNDLTAIGYDNSYVEIFDFNKINSITKFQAHYSDNDNYDIMYINELKDKRLITSADNLIKIKK